MIITVADTVGNPAHTVAILITADQEVLVGLQVPSRSHRIIGDELAIIG